jgi:hypothetical protein
MCRISEIRPMIDPSGLVRSERGRSFALTLTAVF